MVEWTEEQSSRFTKLYDRLTQLPNYDEIKGEVNSQLFPKEPLPYEEAENRLLKLVSQHRGQGNLESIVENPSKQNGVSRVAERIGRAVYNAVIPAGIAATLALYLL